MYLGSAILSAVLVLAPFQSPADSFRRHYETAEAARRAGNFTAAETEYTAIVGEASHEIGKVYLAQSNYPAAVDALETAATLDADANEVLVDLAIAYFHVDQYEKAETPLATVLKRDPRSVAGHHMLGKCLFMLGAFPKATAELQTALRLAPGDYDVAYTLGLAYLKQRQLPQAKQIFARMIARLGDKAPLRVLLGRAYRETGFLAEAIVEFKRAATLDAHFPRVHYYLGLTYLLKDGAARIDDAAAEFAVELASHPDDYFANYYLGILSNIGRKWEEAIRLLEKASAAQPNNPDPYFHLGQAYQGAQRHEKAVEVLRKSIALTTDVAHNDYQVATAHYRLGQSLLRLGKDDEGERELQLSSDLKSKSVKHDENKTEAYLSTEAVNAQPGVASEGEGIVAEATAPAAAVERDLRAQGEYLSKVLAAAFNSIGLLRADQKDFRDAASRFAEAAKWNPSHEGVQFNLGLARYRAGMYGEAIDPLRRETAQHPENLAATQLLGLCYFAVEDFAHAADALGSVARARPEDATLDYPLALALEKVGRTDEAQAIIQRMVAAGGSSPQLHVLLGQAYAEQGDSDKALEELRLALSLDPKTPDAHFYAGMLFVKSGKFDDAIREFAAELATNPGDLRAQYHLAFAMLSQGDVDGGIATLRTVIAARPDYADARYELGKALLQKGDVAGAIDNLEAAAKIDPAKPHVHYQLGRAYMAAGRATEGERELDTAKQLNDKARGQANQQ